MNLRRPLRTSRRAASDPVYPVAVTDGVSPSTGDRWGGDQTGVSVTGTDFVRGARVRVDGVPVDTVFVSSTELTCTIPKAVMQTNGAKSVTVVNPAAPASNAQTYTVSTYPTRDTTHKFASTGIAFGNEGLESWSDRITDDADKDAEQLTDANQPTWNASNEEFNWWETIDGGADDFMVTGTFDTPIAQPYTHYIVAKAPASKVAKHSVVDGLDGSHRGSIYAAQTTGYVGMHGGTALESTVVWSGSILVVCCIFDGANSKIFINRYGTASATGNAGAHGLTGLKYLTDVNDNTWGGSLAETIVMTGADTAAQREGVMTYLAEKYGLTVTS